jgi:imidazolonepropionase-like amidohydrolase
VVKGSTIDSVSQGDLADALLDRAERVVDRRDWTVLPGLIDMHAHLNLSAGRIPPEQWALEPEGVIMVHAAAAAQTALDADITTIRDCGSHGQTVFNLRRAFELGVACGPRLVLAGPPLTITGGHGWSFGGEADGPRACGTKSDPSSRTA